ncbi:hypothetical protein BDW22DRAFT_1345817 [Trametopsis cervina]|nr:hypothetical protein BDW22DRAFT_1345817 [Trametopsis cervina]
MKDRENRSKKRAKPGKERLKRTNKERTLTNDSEDRGNAQTRDFERTVQVLYLYIGYPFSPLVDNSARRTLETADEQQPLKGHHYEGDYLAEGYDEYQEGTENEEDEASHLDFHMMHANHSSTDEEVSYWEAVEDLDLSALMLGSATGAELLAESEHGAIVPHNLEADL